VGTSQLQASILSYGFVLSLVSETTIVGSGTSGVAGLAASGEVRPFVGTSIAQTALVIYLRGTGRLSAFQAINS
jgi:hypothetical protein